MTSFTCGDVVRWSSFLMINTYKEYGQDLHLCLTNISMTQECTSVDDNERTPFRLAMMIFSSKRYKIYIT